jgi:hypothetical protein
VNLNLRCSLLKEHGWNVPSAGSGHEGVIRFGQEKVDAVITGELKRLRPPVPVIIVVTDARTLVNGATQQANAVDVKAQEALTLIDALKALLLAR